MGGLARLLAATLLLTGAASAQDLLPSKVQVGEPLPALQGVDLDGKSRSLAEVRGKGTLVLSFWSVHCGDCIRELEDLRLIRKEFQAEQVTVVAVNTDSGYPVPRIADLVRRYEAARGEPLQVVHLLDRNAAIMEVLGLRFIPLLIVCDPGGRVSSILTGYAPGDRPRVTRAMEEGRVALGGWGADLRAKLRTVLRGSDPGGRKIEWGTFRVEEGMPLFGLYDARGWLMDAAGRRDRATEAARVEEAVAEGLKMSLLRAALGSVGVRLLPAAVRPFQPRGAQVPEGPLQGDGPWARLYEAVAFDEIYKEQQRASRWVADEYWGALVGDVDLGALRERLEALGVPSEPRRIRLETLSDFDFKSRALFAAFERRSFRLQAVEGDEVLYYGSAGQLVEELKGLNLPEFRVFVEAREEGVVRVEVF